MKDWNKYEVHKPKNCCHNNHLLNAILTIADTSNYFSGQTVSEFYFSGDLSDLS